MIQINYSTAFKALDVYIDQYNQSKKKSTEKIKSAVTLTAKEIIRIYGVYLLKAKAIPADGIPPLRTNNHQLAGLAKCSTRSIQRYIQKLQDAGIITHKIWHGSNSSYELLINPDILLTTPEPPAFTAKSVAAKTSETQPKQDFQVDQKTNWLHTYTSYVNNNIIIDVDHVDNLEPEGSPSSNAGNDAGYSIAGHTEGKIGSELKEKNKPGPADDGPEHQASVDFYVFMLWTLAQNTLYQDKFVTPEQEVQAKRHLRKLYEPVSAAQLPRVHQIYTERIALASKYVKKDPQRRYVQLPHRYFDVTNNGGFVGTKKWWQIDNQRKKEVQRKLVLHAQVRKYQHNVQKVGNKQRPPLQVYQECEQRLGKLQDPSLLQQFHAAILTPNIYNQLYSKTQN
jgi:hypothetical protein